MRHGYSARYGAAIFDMDGLIVDSEPYWRIAERTVFSSVGVPVTGRPPEVHYRGVDGVTPRLQRVSALIPDQRNILRLIFCNPRVRAAQYDWESVARFVVATFRADAARAGASSEIEALVAELSRASPDFAAMWRDNDVRAHGEGTKTFRHPIAGKLALEYSAFAVDGRPDLNMVVYNPATPADADRLKSLIARAR